MSDQSKVTHDLFGVDSAVSQAMTPGGPVRPGDRVRLMPTGGADIFDLALAGKTAIVEAIEQDLENQLHIAVVLDDDPGREFGRMRKPAHCFFFRPEEVRPLGADERGMA